MMKQKLNCKCQKPYKLIIVDLNMPRMGGLEMIEQLKVAFKLGQLKSYEKETIFVLSTAECSRNSTEEQT